MEEREPDEFVMSTLCDVLQVDLVEQSGTLSLIPLDFSEPRLRVVLERPIPPREIINTRVSVKGESSIDLSARVENSVQLSPNLWQSLIQLDESPELQTLQTQLERFFPAEEDLLIPIEESASEFKLQEVSEEELDRLGTLAKVCEVFNSTFGVPEILQRAMEVLLKATGANRCLFLIDRGQEKLEIPAACGTSPEVSKQYSKTVVNRVKDTGKPIISRDVVKDKNLKNVDSLTAMGVRSILCVPVRTPERDFGLIYLDSDVETGVFKQKEMRLASVIAGLAASSLVKAEYFAQMIQGEKMAALGTLLTGTIHELNNPLSAILSIGELLQLETGENELTDTLVSEAKRCSKLVNQLLLTARTGTGATFEKVCLDEVVERTISVIGNELEKHNIELVLTEEDSLSNIMGNSDRLGQILLNLLFNAIYEVKDLQRAQIQLRLFERQDRVYMVIADNGPGIPGKHLQRLLEPFFTTKPAGEGTGMGLAIAHRLVKEHNGEISIENSDQGGAVFTVSFPALMDNPVAEDSGAAS